ncbi:hypothetical protein L5515_006307 [Caenorhabditis briggsae]|uniref:aralkylamine N-acetyltransferase n=5 Tax=Caenorhabditis briggsae TaxID=6238 RepID=A0AAE9F1A3_CAEBR|nr:hypothetical protein L5515_006307 [Caenorhabditis briggsae]
MSDDPFAFVLLTHENAAELSEFLNSHFLFEEPMNRACGMTQQNFQPFVDKLFERTLNIPFSYALVDKETNKIVACAMSSLWKNESKAESENHGDEFEFDNGERKEIGVLGKILTELHAKFFELRPDIAQVLHLEILSVAKDYQRKGLASRLMSKMEDAEKIKEFNCSGIASEISSLANQCLMKKRGYTTITETLLSSECNASGNPFIVTDDGTDRIILVHKNF